MASPKLMTAIEARITDHWTATPIVRAADGQELPADASAILVVQYPLGGMERQASLNAGTSTLWETTGGVFRLVYCVPKGADLDAAAEAMETLRRALRGRIDTDEGWIRMVGVSEPHGPSDDGVWWEIAVVAEYRTMTAG